MKDSVENLNEIKVGYKLETGERERTVIYVFDRTKDYVIYEIFETGQITYKTSCEYQDNTHLIALQLDKVESYLAENKLLWMDYKNTMADIYALYLSNDDEKRKSAVALLEQVNTELDYNKYSKLYYLMPCLIAVVIVCTISLFLKSYSSLPFTSSWPSIDHSFIILVHTISFGSIGGLLSIAVNIDKHQDRISRLRWERVFAGIFRILISMISGLIVYVIFKANFLSRDTSADNYFEYALAIIAGFSQNLVPNLVNKGEQIIIKGK